MPHVWALIRDIELIDAMKDKLDMNVETVVSIITGDKSDSDWNDSSEEETRERQEDSFLLDKLSMELGKMADTGASVTSVNFVVRLRL